MDMLNTSSIPYRQIRAIYDDKTITVYQAYSASIAVAAVREQHLNASPDFLLGRMTWIKPSWCWMMCAPNAHNSTSSYNLTGTDLATQPKTPSRRASWLSK